MLKKVGTEARKDMEAFFGKKVFLETHVKVAENWRKEKHKSTALSDTWSKSKVELQLNEAQN